MCFSPSPKTMRTVTLLGAGILVGTALIIIIPEGIHLWYVTSRIISADRAHSHSDSVCAFSFGPVATCPTSSRWLFALRYAPHGW